MPIYTKQGDKGETGLPGRRRLGKSDTLFDFLGSVDTLNAQIGVTITQIPTETSNDDIITHLHNIQWMLLSIGATTAAVDPQAAQDIHQLSQQVSIFEKQIDAWEEKLPTLENFILPGGTAAASNLHLARTLSREAERYYHKLNDSYKTEEVAQYLNRLSDFLFQAARYQNYVSATKEYIWKN